MKTEQAAAAPATSQAHQVDRPELEFDRLLRMGSSLVKTRFLPNAIQTPDQAAMIILTGRELGIPAMQSLRTINVIQGKPALSAELMAALVLRAGHKIEWIGSTETDATCKITRKDGGSFTGSFTIAGAKRAGLVKAGGGWEKYPAALLRARALSLTARAICPDAIAGFHLAEEMGAEVDEAGAPVPSVPASEESTTETSAAAEAAPAPAADEPGDGESGTYVGPVLRVEELKKAKVFFVIHGEGGFRCRTFSRTEADFATEAHALNGEVRIEWVQTRYGPKLLQITATGEGTAPETSTGAEEEVPF